MYTPAPEHKSKPDKPQPRRRRGHAFLWFAGYLAFVVYGSLIPFEFRSLDFDQALRGFAAIPYLDLGVASRADWIANIVLYIPLAFLGCAWLAGMRTTSLWCYLALTTVFLFCLAVAITLEFSQQYFAPRTVSLNDLLAETLGTLIGLSAWSFGRGRLMQLWDAFASGGRRSVLAAAVAYALIYTALALFPYDFVVSPDELAARLRSPGNGWLSGGGCGATVRCLARLAADAMAIAPLGTLLALAAPGIPLGRFFLAGIGVGLGLEALQLLLASGTAQGLSVVMRGAGFAAGAAVGQVLRRHGVGPAASILHRALPWLTVPYLWLVAKLGGWFSGPWRSLAETLEHLPRLHFMPFYYHYFSTEPVAMASLLAHAGLYAPVGLALWARNAALARSHHGGARHAALWTAAIALPIELGKLPVAGQHPDFTNMLIGAVAAASAYATARWLQRVLDGGAAVPVRKPTAAPSTRPAPAATPTVSWPPPHPIGAVVGSLAAGAAILGLITYPVSPLVATLLLAAYAAWLRYRPGLVLFALPALLPTLDLSPFTGRTWLDEFDLAVLIGLAVGYWRAYGIRPLPWANRWLPIALGLLWLTWLAATARGLWPLWRSPAGLAPGSHTPLEAWMVGKGLLWALLSVPILRRLAAPNPTAARASVLGGLLVGLVLVTLAVLWERHRFIGLGDFDHVFRVTATFANMHTGGAYIEAFIAFAFPLLTVWVLHRPDWLTRLLGLLAVAAASYAMLVTFSRVGYVALATGLAVVALGTLRRRHGPALRRGSALLGIAAVAVAAAVPVLSGGFAQQRLADTFRDLQIREAHWSRALALMDDGPMTALIGMGFGRYPSVYLFRAQDRPRPGTFGLRREGDNSYLSLGVGEPLFLNQRIRLEPESRYRLSARLRQPYGSASLEVYLCEKTLLYSFRCVTVPLHADAPGDIWRQVEVGVDSDTLGADPWPPRPATLALHNPGPKHLIDVDDIRLRAADGRDLLSNGDYQDGMARWLFVTDQDLAWHIHQQWVELYFAQGALGVAALTVLLIGVARPLARGLLAGDPQATAFAAALTAFLTVGLLGSTLDTARLSLLLYLGAFAAGCVPPTSHGRSAADTGTPPRPHQVGAADRSPRPRTRRTRPVGRGRYG